MILMRGLRSQMLHSTMLSTVKQAYNTPEDNFIGIFLYGSQNYQLDTAESDVDTIMLVYTADYPKQEMHVDCGKMKVYTLRYFISRLKKGDMRCYEILYTKYRILNPMYKSAFLCFVDRFTECMNYDRIKRSLWKKLDEHMCNILWILRNEDNSRYNKKRLYWAMRVANQLDRINNGESFESSLVYRSDDDYSLVKIKAITNYLSLREFNNIYRDLNQYRLGQFRHTSEVTNEEKSCLSEFYDSMTTILHNQGGYLS